MRLPASLIVPSICLILTLARGVQAAPVQATSGVGNTGSITNALASEKVTVDPDPVPVHRGRNTPLTATSSAGINLGAGAEFSVPHRALVFPPLSTKSKDRARRPQQRPWRRAPHPRRVIFDRGFIRQRSFPEILGRSPAGPKVTIVTDPALRKNSAGQLPSPPPKGQGRNEKQRRHPKPNSPSPLTPSPVEKPASPGHVSPPSPPMAPPGPRPWTPGKTVKGLRKAGKRSYTW